MVNFTEKQKTALIASAIGLALGVGIGNSLPWYGSEEECMLRESKGMPRDTQHLVRRYCIEKFSSPRDEGAAAEPPAVEAPPADAPAPEAAPYPST
jgi:hypothetical protein